MKKLLSTVLLAFVTCSLMAQQLNNFTSATETHRLVSGTRLYLIPPINFLESKYFKGFQNPIDPATMILITELPAPFEEIYKGFTAENLKSRGMELIDRKEVMLNGASSLLLTIDQTSNGRTFTKNILVFGDSKSTTMVNGVYLKGSNIGIDVLNAIKTVYVDNSMVADPRASLDYQMDETVGKFKFLGVMGNGFLFNRDGKTPTQSPDKASLITDKSFAQVVVPDKKNFALNRIKGIKKDSDTLTNVRIGEVEINGLQGYQIYATNKNKSEEICQVILYPENGGYYLFVGTYLTGNAEALNDIKKVIGTFKRK